MTSPASAGTGEPAPGASFGRFTTSGVLGRGATGVVLAGFDPELDRKVAIKILYSAYGDPDGRDRLQREAQAMARLSHPNAVTVYDVGRSGDRLFVAMELVDGQTLRGWLEKPRDWREIVAMFVAAGRGLQAAHRAGLVHRDFKPENVLIGRDGRPRVSDFGLATATLGDDPAPISAARVGASLTVRGIAVGTPAYMSPEQVTAGRVPVDHRTDIYSLGATLYELLTLRPPFRAEGRDQLLAQVMQKEPPAPRSVDLKIPRDLETICLKCLEKDPDRRYQTAKDLADDLRRFLNRFAILARRAGPLARAKKWVKRNPVPAVLLGCLLVAVLGAGVFALQAKRSGDLLRERDRQAAVERAILESMSGDAGTALRAIAQAERAGAAPGQLNMLRGLVELNRGHLKEAFVYLEQAEQQWPDSVAVKALLATAYLRELQYRPYAQMAILAEKLGPKAAEDFIFLGQTQALIDPRQGLETLDRAPTRARQSPVARLTRAVIQTGYAQQTGSAADAEEALKDIDRVDLADNPLLLNTHVQALLTAARAAGPEPSARAGYRKRAEAVAVQLARFPDLPTAIQGRCLYYFAAGDDPAVLGVVREGKRRVADPAAFAMYEFYALYRRKQFEQALASLGAVRPSDGPWPLVRRAVALATLGRTAEAERLLLDNLHTSTAGSVPGYLYFLGPAARTDPRQATGDVLKQAAQRIPDWRGGWYRDLLKFNAGQLDAAELVDRAGASRFNQCEGYFFIGLHKLHERKRAEAKAWFQKSADTGIYAYGEYMWSSAFLACIDDLSWLPWAVEKE